MPRPSQKEKILQAAVQSFAELGYDGTRVRHIAQRAGVSDAALYRHYPSIEALAQELFAHYFGDYARRLAEATSEGTTEEKLRAVVHKTLSYYRAEPAATTFVLVRQQTFMQKLPANTVYPIAIVSQIIATGQRRRELRAGQPKLLAAIFLGCVLRPIQLSSLAADALDLLHETRHDRVIEEAALAALRRARSRP